MTMTGTGASVGGIAMPTRSTARTDIALTGTVEGRLPNPDHDHDHDHPTYGKRMTKAAATEATDLARNETTAHRDHDRLPSAATRNAAANRATDHVKGAFVAILHNAAVWWG